MERNQNDQVFCPPHEVHYYEPQDKDCTNYENQRQRYGPGQQNYANEQAAHQEETPTNYQGTSRENITQYHEYINTNYINWTQHSKAGQCSASNK